MKITITIKNFFAEELSRDIVNYIRRKPVAGVSIQLDHGPSTETKTFTSHQFNQLTQCIEDYLDHDSARFFYLDVPEIKTSIQSFTYGVDIISEQEDIEDHFSEYQSEEV